MGRSRGWWAALPLVWLAVLPPGCGEVPLASDARRAAVGDAGTTRGKSDALSDDSRGVVDDTGGGEAAVSGPPTCPDNVPALSVPAAPAQAPTPAAAEQLTERLVSQLTSRFEATAELAARAAPACNSAQALSHGEALLITGELEACVGYARSCVEGTLANEPLGAAVAFAGARCAQLAGDVASAEALFDASTSGASERCAGHAGRVLTYAYYLEVTGASERSQGLLGRAQRWSSPAEQTLATAALRALVRSSTAEFAADVKRFVEAAVAGSDPVLARLVLALWLNRLQGDNRWSRILGLIDANLAHLGLSGQVTSLPGLAAAGQLHGWIGAAYRSLHSLYPESDAEGSSGAGDFFLARRLYDAYHPFSHAAAWLPVQFNSYSVSQLEQQACRDQLSGADSTTQQGYQKLRQQWQDGTLTLAQALSSARQLTASHPDLADLLTLEGTLLELSQRYPEASESYLRAHRSCPYYNRAHAGLQSVRRRQVLQALPGYSGATAGLEQALAGVDFADLATFTLNAEILPPWVLTRLRAAVVLWAPYLERLTQAGFRLHLKLPFEHLSDTPGNQHLRDKQLSVSSEYQPFYDDLYGQGGSTAVVDIGFTMDSAFGARNIAAHEIAHQVHMMAASAIDPCIAALYRGATARGVFADSYSSVNRREYFAQGVTFYAAEADQLVPASATRGWLAQHDPDLHSFLGQIFAASNPLDALTCPAD